jgi:nitrate reductase (cytochrome), electron transfer subunit
VRVGQRIASGIVCAALITLGAAAAPPDLTDPARGPVAIPDATQPPRLGNAVNDDVRRPRNFDLQPPTIPHRIDGYQVDKNFNKCLDCHAREKTDFSRAIPVSETHYIDRAGKVLDRISTRRYFCMQCHVAQDAVPPLVDNTFRRIDARPAPASR